MNILILHKLGPKEKWTKAVADLELSLVRHDKKNNYIVHNSLYPFPDFFKRIKYDAIILWSTFLDARHSRILLDKFKSEYAFVADSDAVKIALAQDDYYCYEELDNWMVEWKVDFLYSVIHEFQHIFFKNFLKSGGVLRKGYTGYVSDELISLSGKVREFTKRKIDISYRASGTPTNINRLANLKSTIGERFLSRIGNTSMHVDISTRSQDWIFGEKWIDFVSDSKSMIGVNSGSSLLIHNLTYVDMYKDYIERNPGSSYDEIRKACFSDQDESMTYTAISPRNIEAALLKTCQINTTLGDYSGILDAGTDYIALHEDCNNAEDVINCLKDQSYTMGLIDNACHKILDIKELRLNHLIQELLTTIDEKLDSSFTPESRFRSYMMLYRNYEYYVELKRTVKKHIPDGVKKMIKK